ncbi:hypothetical protein HHK36_015555 [Tetracentron sinense]|uniref:Aminotransferase-like plant mobile domain-containing protein n=1 Tax=Tetracentron sinense TaxID=13715 RepID=A0A834Z152_TETSI|nr:hypothetical protein HHK36_015555 [Tetracentron sinense]
MKMGREKRSKRYHDSAASSSTAAVSGLEPDADEAQADLPGDEDPVPEVRARRNRRGRRRNDEGDEVLDSGGEPARVEESSDEEISGWGMVPEEYRNIPDTPLLSGLSSHLSAYARPNPGVPTLYSGIRGAWGKAYALCSGVSEDVREQLSTFGFGYFIMIPAFRCDRKWLLALMERWFDETNTFHFPYFEMGITPTDFVMLTGIRFGGTPLRLRRINKARIMDLMGVPPENRAASNKDIFDRGNSPSLLNVELNGHLMEAALACWNPSISVFRFGSTEIAPTLEEYARLLRVSLESDIVMPIFPESYKNKFVRLLGIRRNSLEKLGEENSFQRCTLKFLIDHFAPRNPAWISTPMYTGKEEEWPKHRANALALAIAGHLLFPMSYVCIDAALVDIIVQIESGHTFVPMLLAETFRALNQCSSQRRGFFKGCQSLLQIWLLEHLSFCNPLRSVGLFRQDLIHLHCHFSEPPSSLCRPEEWHACLISSQDNFVWRCLWFHDFKPVLNFPGRNHMILVGLHGSALYAPNRVVRQFGWTQDIPVVDEEICDVVDFGPSSGTLIAQLAKAWREREVWNAYDDKCEEPLATKEYALWIRQLVDEVPSVSSYKKRKFQQPVAISYIDFIAKERVRHENLIRIAQKEIAELKDQNASLLSENAFLKNKAGTSLSLSNDDATSRAEVASLMEEVVSLRAKVTELHGLLVGYDISRLAWMDEALELRKQVSTLERINEHFRYVQAPVGSQEAVILSMNADLARLRKTLRNLGHVSSDESD